MSDDAFTWVGLYVIISVLVMAMSFIAIAKLSLNVDVLGELICDEQYGVDASFVFFDHYDVVVECELESLDVFDGGFTRLVGDE